MNDKEGLKQEAAQKLAKKFEDDYQISKFAENLKDNKIEFIHNEITYRVRLLNLAEKEQLHFLRLKKYSQLLRDNDILLDKDLRKIYKDRGIIDIDELDNEVEKLEIQRKDLNLKLGESLEKDYNDTILKTYETQIKEINEKINTIIIQKNSFLEDSLENQLLNYVAQYITCLSLEKKVDNDWVKVFDSPDGFNNCEDEQLVNLATKHALYLQYFGV